MTKLTDTQLVILSAAAARDDGAILPLPENLSVKGGAVTAVLKSLLKKGLVAEKPAARGQEVWREGEDGGAVTLMIAEAGLEAIGVDAGDATGSNTGVSKPAARKKGARGTGRSTAAAKPKAGAAPTARPGTKQAMLIDLLGRKQGATIDEVVAATGWQAHSVRGAISGTLKKKHGLTVTSEKVEGRGRVYCIAGNR